MFYEGRGKIRGTKNRTTRIDMAVDKMQPFSVTGKTPVVVKKRNNAYRANKKRERKRLMKGFLTPYPFHSVV